MKSFTTEDPVELVLEVRATSSDANVAVLTLDDGRGHVASTSCTLDGTRLIRAGDGAPTWNELLGQFSDSPQAVRDDDLAAFGADLFAAVIGSTSLLRVWEAASPANGAAILTIEFGPLTERFARLPFELLRHRDAYVFARPECGLQRVLLETPPERLALSSSPRVLFAWACPVGVDKFDPAPHTSALRAIFAGDFEELADASLESLGARLREAHQQGRPYEVVHLLAHGSTYEEFGAICLNGASSGPSVVPAEALARAIAGNGVRLSFLCSCQSAQTPRGAFSGVAQQLLARHGADLPCVVATQGNLPVRGSAELAAQFYGLLLSGVTPAVALARARKLAFDSGGGAWATPVLLTRPERRAAASRQHLPADASVPAPRSTYLSRNRLEQRVLAGIDKHRLVSLVGLPGIGKTEIGIQVAHAALGRVAERVEYLVIGSGATPTQVRTLIAARFGAARPPETDSELAYIVSSSGASVLLVLDNAEDLMLDDAAQQDFRAQLDTWLAAAPNLRVMLTTRWPVGSTREREHEVRIPPLDRADIEELLVRELSDKGVFRQSWRGQEAWSSLLDIIDGHPRTLWLIASQIEDREGSMAQVTTRLSVLKADAVVAAEVLGRADQFALVGEREQARLQSLVASMDLSFEVLSRRHPQAAELFLGLSFFPTALPESIAQTIAGGAQSTALNDLYRYHLVEWRDDRTFFPVPLRWYADHKRAETGFDASTFVDRAWPGFADYMEQINVAFSTDEVRGVTAALAIAPSLRRLAEFAPTTESPGRTAAAPRLAPAARDTLVFASRFDLLALLAQEGLAAARLSGDARGSANCLLSQGDLKMRVDDFDGARKDYAAALSTYREIPDPPGVASCLHCMGNLKKRVDDLDGAREDYDAALSIYRAIFDRLGEANCLVSLGDLKTRSNDLDAAREVLDAALAIYRDMSDRLGEANCLKGLGNHKARVDELDGARNDYTAALLIYREIRGRLGEAHCLRGLGELKMREADLDGARENYSAALHIYRKIRDRLGEANCLVSLGDLKRLANDLDGARAELDAALLIYREIRDRLGEANCLQAFGLLELARRRRVTAFRQLAHCREAFRELRSALGEQASLGYLAQTSADVRAHDQGMLLADESLIIGRFVRDALGQAFALQIQERVLIELHDYAAALGCKLQRLELLRAMSQQREATGLSQVLDQVRAQTPAKSWAALAADPESFRLAAVEAARARFAKTGRSLFEPPPEATD